MWIIICVCGCTAEIQGQREREMCLWSMWVSGLQIMDTLVNVFMTLTLTHAFNCLLTKTRGSSLAKSEKRFKLVSIRLCFLQGFSSWNSLTLCKPEGLQHGLGSVTHSDLIISCYAITRNSVFVIPMQWVDFRSHLCLSLCVLPSLFFLYFLIIITLIVFHS